jgi:hypothetical protein
MGMEYGKVSMVTAILENGGVIKHMDSESIHGIMVNQNFNINQPNIGDRYEGEWKKTLKHGLGTDLFANGDKYVGEYRYGRPEGRG